MPEFHQIWHGDSRELALKIKPKTIDAIITDPPFGIDNKSKMAKTQAGKEYARKIAGDESPEQAIALFNEVMEATMPACKDECDIYIFTSHHVLKEWLEVADQLGIKHGFVRRAILVWEKTGPGMGDLESWGASHEFIIYLKRGRRLKQAPRRSGVLHVPQIVPRFLIHPHEKPAALLELFIKHSTAKGDFVFDPFGGSGSLVRAARSADRNAVAIEYDENNYNKAMEALNSASEGFGF